MKTNNIKEKIIANCEKIAKIAETASPFIKSIMSFVLMPIIANFLVIFTPGSTSKKLKKVSDMIIGITIGAVSGTGALYISDKVVDNIVNDIKGIPVVIKEIDECAKEIRNATVKENV